MKIVTIPCSAFATLEGELTTADWLAFYAAHGVDSAKVIRSYPAQDEKSVVFESED